MAIVVIASSITGSLTTVYAAGALPQAAQGEASILSVLGMLLAFLVSGPGVAALLSGIDNTKAFSALSTNGRLLTAVAIAAASGLSIYEIQKLLLSQPEIVARIDEWLRVVWPLGTVLYTQLAHGSRKSSEVSGVPAGG
jgi:hypothetical protein